MIMPGPRTLAQEPASRLQVCMTFTAGRSTQQRPRKPAALDRPAAARSGAAAAAGRLAGWCVQAESRWTPPLPACQGWRAPCRQKIGSKSTACGGTPAATARPGTVCAQRGLCSLHRSSRSPAGPATGLLVTAQGPLGPGCGASVDNLGGPTPTRFPAFGRYFWVHLGAV